MVTRVQSVGLGAVVLMALGLVGLGLYGVVLVIRLGGIIAGCALFATVVSFALAAVEVRRSGQAKLVGVGLAVALVTLCVAVAEVLWGSIQTLGALGAWPGSPDAADLLRAGAAGLAEAAYSPLAALPLAVAQVLVWALVARRNALRDEAKGAQVGRHRPG
jgi:hypothetical protein